VRRRCESGFRWQPCGSSVGAEGTEDPSRGYGTSPAIGLRNSSAWTTGLNVSANRHDRVCEHPGDLSRRRQALPGSPWARRDLVARGPSTPASRLCRRRGSPAPCCRSIPSTINCSSVAIIAAFSARLGPYERAAPSTSSPAAQRGAATSSRRGARGLAHSGLVRSRCCSGARSGAQSTSHRGRATRPRQSGRSSPAWLETVREEGPLSASRVGPSRGCERTPGACWGLGSMEDAHWMWPFFVRGKLYSRAADPPSSGLYTTCPAVFPPAILDTPTRPERGARRIF